MTTVTRAVLRLSLVLLIAAHVYAQGRPGGPGTGKPDDHLVPWKFVETGAAVEKGSLTLYWIPSSQKEMEQSELLSSRLLLEDTLRCVAARIVLPENTATIELLGATGTLPTALLVDSQGTVIRHIVNARAVLPPASVEQMVKAELAARDEAMYHQMSDARKRAAAGDKDGAITLYKTVWNDRCFFPMAGTEAQRALKTLGVEVHDVPAPSAVDPQLKKPAPKPPAPPGG
jgi:hypothetical protein